MNIRLDTMGFDSTVSAYFVVGVDAAHKPPSAESSPVIRFSAAQAGWDGCAASGGTKVTSVFVGPATYHAYPDVSWRVRTKAERRKRDLAAVCTVNMLMRVILLLAGRYSR